PANCLSLGSIGKTHKKKLLDQGMMFWNHFQFFSGLAIQCHPQQRTIDQVLSIYLKDDTAKMDKTKMTYCGIQVKNLCYLLPCMLRVLVLRGEHEGIRLILQQDLSHTSI
ncbi:uncharacterized protein VP01_9515g1, partial [Puccinia sorghi]